MHFAKTEKGQTKLSRAFAIVLSLMIIVSMVVVGDVGSISASAATFTITSGTTLYIDLTEVNSWWFNDGGTLKLYWFNDSANTKDVYTVATSSNSSGVYSYTFSSDVTCEGLIVRRDITNTEWKNQTVDIKDYNGNCIKVKEQSGKKGYEWKNYTPPTYGEYLTAANGFGVGTDAAPLIPVPAVFYDYYTDYEVTNGWRSVVRDGKSNEVSRKYDNSFPYDKLNEYINNKVDSNWKVPLFFGNFYTGHSMSYDTSARVISFGDTGYENLNSSNNSNIALKNFSSQANNSMFMRDSDSWEKGSAAWDGSLQRYSDASKSYVGLINDVLTNDKLTMGKSSIDAPYFSDDLVDKNLATKVTTVFPMRVVTTNANRFWNDSSYSANGSYETYIFDSNNGTDNVYFTNYGTDDFTVNYANNSHKVNDALMGFGGEQDGFRENGVGFFPFDNSENNSGEAYDFGFGMRLDIPFNIGVNAANDPGYIDNSNIPMTFNFSGDDDVWVFIDGKLALDLGGDHKQARGKIDFAAKKAIIETGVYKPGQYGSNIYGNPTTAESTARYGLTYTQNGNNYEADLSNSALNYSDANWSNIAKPHTLTVFYMERGLSESNLKLEFTMSPLKNELEVDKSVDVSGVNNVLKDAVEASAKANDKFDYTVEVADDNSGTAGTYSGTWQVSYPGKAATTARTYSYMTQIGSQSGGTLTTDGKAENIPIDNGFIIDRLIAEGKWIKVTESPQTANKYSYDSYMTVEDVSNESTDDVGKTDNVSFKYKTAKSGGITNFAVHNTNKIKTALVTLTKKLYESDGTTEVTGDDTEFEISVSQIKLPDGTTISSFANKLTTDTKETGNGVFTLRGGESVTIDKLPVGTEITFTENSAPTDYMIETGTATVMVNAAGTAEAVIKNKLDAITPAEYTPSVTKHVNGHGLSSDENFFSFTMEEVNSSGNPLSGEHYNVTKTADVSNSKATFTKITFTNSETRYFKITENDLSAAAATAGYTKDNTSFFVKCVATLNGRTVTVDKTFYKGSLNNTDKLTAEEAALVFNNKKNGFLKIVKTDSAGSSNDDLAGTEFTYYKVSGNGAAVPTTGGVKAVVQKNGNAISWVSESSVELGWYAVVETKSAAGFELNGEVKYVEVKENNTAADPATVTFTNRKSTELPQTGGIGVVVMIVGGLALIALGVYLLKTDKKDEKSE